MNLSYKLLAAKSDNRGWNTDEGGVGPTQRTLSMERQREEMKDVRNVPTDYKRYPDVRL